MATTEDHGVNADIQKQVSPDAFQTQEMVLNVGPQHPATHGVFRLLATIDGEILTTAEPIIGYMHRGYEKLVEARDYRQITNLVSRMDWLSGINNELPLALAIEKLMGVGTHNPLVLLSSPLYRRLRPTRGSNGPEVLSGGIPG